MIDWKTVTGTLRSHHGSLARAGRATGVCGEQIRKLNRGEIENPRFSTGLKIMHELKCIDHEQFERVARSLW